MKKVIKILKKLNKLPDEIKDFKEWGNLNEILKNKCYKNFRK